VATRPVSQLHLAAAGLHSKGFRATRDGQVGEGFLAQNEVDEIGQMCFSIIEKSLKRIDELDEIK
jgi:hypothetical protein